MTKHAKIGLTALLLSVLASPASSAQPAPTGALPRLILLGTAGGPIIRSKRSQPSNLLVVDGSAYMIDAGSGALQRLVQAGYKAQDVDAIFITHHHLDHDGGVPDLVEFSTIGQRSRPVDIIGPVGTRMQVEGAILSVAPSRKAFGDEGLITSSDPKSIFRARDIDPSGAEPVIFSDKNIKVTACENSHNRYLPVDKSDPSPQKSYGYRIDTHYGTIFFTGDTGPDQRLVACARGADTLVTEVIDLPSAVDFATRFFAYDAAGKARTAEHMASEHMVPAEIGKLAAEAGVRRVVLTHFVPGEDKETSVNQYFDEIRKYFHGQIVVGNDLDVVEFGKPPSEGG
jgi:ribonuclease BN (tRNA processing enzyme)